MHWYLDVLKRYVDFNGRARRQEYWMFVLFNFIFVVIANVIDGVAGTYGIISLIYSLAILLPALGVFVRRLHDTGRSGFWFFIGLIPLIGAIVLIIFLVQDSEPGTNNYGPNPKGIL